MMVNFEGVGCSGIVLRPDPLSESRPYFFVEIKQVGLPCALELFLSLGFGQALWELRRIINSNSHICA